MRYWLLAFLLALDTASKWAALHFLPRKGIAILPDLFGVTFSLDFVTNTGTAWGLFAGHPQLLFWFRVVILVALVVYALKKKGSVIPFWLVAVGALGNVLDYCFYGHVIDFLHFTFWGYSFPVFNFADSYITLGVFALLVLEGKWKRLQTL